MKFFHVEIEAMREQLGIFALQALLRQLPGNRGEVINLVANSLNVTPATIRNFESRAPKKKYAQALAKCAQDHDIRMYPHNFYPTKAICIAWLEFDYICDRGKYRASWQFKYWARDMSKVKVREAA